ncbi:hypothetical protein ACJX0J_016025 [Zea mays]
MYLTTFHFSLYKLAFIRERDLRLLLHSPVGKSMLCFTFTERAWIKCSVWIVLCYSLLPDGYDIYGTNHPAAQADCRRPVVVAILLLCFHLHAVRVVVFYLHL